MSLLHLLICSLLLVARGVLGSLSSVADVDDVDQRDAEACSATTRPRVMTEPSGYFMTTGYPVAYPSNSLCQWRILAQPGQIVSLEFIELITERGYDFVWVFDGSSELSYSILGLDGSYRMTLTGIYSSQQSMFVQFTTDATVPETGFNATYESVDSTGIEDACSPGVRPLTINEYNGTITSKYYPLFYPHGCECQWLIVSQVPNGFVQLDFTFFLTETDQDWVHIYDGNSPSAPMIARLSGGYSPAPTGFLTTQQYMLVRFVTDAQNGQRGFSGTFQSVARADTD